MLFAICSHSETCWKASTSRRFENVSEWSQHHFGGDADWTSVRWLLFGRRESSVLSLRRVTGGIGPGPFPRQPPGPPSHQLFGRMDDNHLLWREIRALVLVLFLIIWIIHSLIVKIVSQGNSSGQLLLDAAENWRAVFAKGSLRIAVDKDYRERQK